MSPNSDNAVARFLFAILKQKNLKDINWDLVAQDPVLLEPISNGHAARMRYFRFRSTVSGSEGRVSKSKSLDKTRGAKPRPRKSDSSSRSSSAAYIKQEFSQNAPLSNYSPASTTSPYLSDSRDDFGPRFLTPCSDDMPSVLGVNPADVEKSQRTAYGEMAPSMGFAEAVEPLFDPAFGNFDGPMFDVADFTSDGHSHPDSNPNYPLDNFGDRFKSHF